MQSDDAYAFAEANPAFAACVLHAASHGYADAGGRPDGLFVPWAMLCLGYAATPAIRAQIPRSPTSKLRILMYKTKPERRLDASPTILAWREPFWDGVRFGLARGYLSTDGARLWQHNSVEVDGDEVEDAMKAARSFGRLLARVPDDLQRARILGVEFE